MRQRGHRRGLPGTGRGQRQRHSAPAACHFPDQCDLALVELLIACGRVCQRQLDIDVLDRAPAASEGGSNDASLSGQQLLRGVGSAAVAAMHAGSIAATQLRRFSHFTVVDIDVLNRQRLGQSSLGDLVGQRLVGGVPAATNEALRLGEHVVALPGRAGPGNRGDDLGSARGDPVVIDSIDLGRRRGQDGAQHRGQLPHSAEHLDRLAAPHVALLGE